MAVAGRRINHGVAALARATGMDSTTVSRKMKQGMTAAQISAQAADWATRNSVQGRNRRVVKETTLKKLKGYVPARRVTVGPVKVEDVTVLVPVETKVEKRRRDRPRKVAQEFVEPVVSKVVSAQGETYQQADLRLKIAQANEREIKAAQLRGELVNKAQVNYVIGTAHVKFRDHLFRLPDELGDTVAFEDDPVKTRKILRDALVQVCSHLRVLTEEMPDVPEDLLEGKVDDAKEVKDVRKGKETE